MVKKIAILLFVLFYGLNNGVVFAEEPEEIGTILERQKTMRGMPDMVSPDSVYLGYSLDKVYYKNSEIARLLYQTNQLLEDMHSLLDELPDDLEKAVTPGSGTEISTLYNQNLQIIALLKEIRDFLGKTQQEEQETPEPKKEREPVP